MYVYRVSMPHMYGIDFFVFKYFLRTGLPINTYLSEEFTQKIMTHTRKEKQT